MAEILAKNSWAQPIVGGRDEKGKGEGAQRNHSLPNQLTKLQFS
jgi:hypothetical protein